MKYAVSPHAITKLCLISISFFAIGLMLYTAYRFRRDALLLLSRNAFSEPTTKEDAMRDDDRRDDDERPEREPTGPGTTAGGGAVRAGRRTDADDDERGAEERPEADR